MSELPNGWGAAVLSDLGECGEQTVLTGPFGANLGREDFIASGVPVFTIGCLGADGIKRTKLLHVSPAKAVELATYRLREGDFLFSRMASVGRAGFVPADLNGALFNYHLMRLRLNSEIVLPQLFYYFVRGSELVRAYLFDVSRGATRDGINTKLLLNMPVHVPPPPEQRRIVAKIDGLSGKSKRARDHLDHIPRLVEKYKQAILAAAFRGDLTREWRETNDSGTSLAKTLREVRNLRQQDKKRSIRKTLAVVPDTLLPESWRWISSDEVADNSAYSIGIGPFGSNLLRSDYQQAGVRLIFVRDIMRERFEEAGARYVSLEKAAELHQHVVEGGDVLITKMGEPPGDTALYPLGAAPAVITSDCIKLRPHPKLAVAKYLMQCIRSDVVRGQIEEITKGVAQQKVSLDGFRTIALPIPPLTEQTEIIRVLDAAFTWVDRLASDTASARNLIDHLDQAVLAKAFRGELVPQDPNDEPASVLLEHIRNESAATLAKTQSGRGRRKGGVDAA
jgi:type I restriction enzyme, S subunit